MNRLKFFKAYEEEDPCNIGDKHEGTSGWFQPDQIRLKIQDPLTGEEHVVEGFSGPVRMGLNRHNDYHVYCMSALHFDDEGGFETVEEVKASMKLDIDSGDLGEFCSIIAAGPFTERLDSVLRETPNIAWGRDLVEYFDPDNFSGSFEEDTAIFRKKNCFSHQKEYRIFVYDGISGDDPRVINIGDLSDIVLNCHKADLHNAVIIGVEAA